MPDPTTPPVFLDSPNNRLLKPRSERGVASVIPHFVSGSNLVSNLSGQSSRQILLQFVTSKDNLNFVADQKAKPIMN
jgi:hypothetical protein